MKAKNISGRLARFLAVLMAMVLIVSCMAIPVALAEESTEVEEGIIFVAVTGFEEEQLSTYKAVSAQIREACPNVTKVKPYLDPMLLPATDYDQLWCIIIEDGGLEFDACKNDVSPKVIFMLDSCIPLSGGSLQADMNSMLWAYTLLSKAVNGTPIYIFCSNSDSVNAQSTRNLVDLIAAMAAGEHPEYGFAVEALEEEPVEVDEEVERITGDFYTVTTNENYKGEPSDSTGVIAVYQLDMSQEDALAEIIPMFCDLLNNQ